MSDLKSLNRKARGLQEIYKAGGEGALNALSADCIVIAFILVKAVCGRYGLHFEHEKIVEYAHDAAAQFIAQYLKHEGYNVSSFSGRIRRDVLNVMFGRARNKQSSFEDGQAQLDDSHNNIAEICAERSEINPSTALDELVADHEQGKKIAADLYRSKSYALAVRRIAGYVGREWIEQHAEKLHFVFKTFRWRPSAKGRILEAGERGVCREVLQGKRAERKQPVRRAGRDAKKRGVK